MQRRKVTVVGRPVRRPLGAHTIFTTNRWIAFFVDCCVGGRNVCYWFQPTNQNCYVYKYSMFCTRFLSPSICCHFMFNWLFQLLYLLFIPVSRSMGDSLYTHIVTYMCNIIRVAPKIEVIFRIFNARELCAKFFKIFHNIGLFVDIFKQLKWSIVNNWFCFKVLYG